MFNINILIKFKVVEVLLKTLLKCYIIKKGDIGHVLFFHMLEKTLPIIVTTERYFVNSGNLYNCNI